MNLRRFLATKKPTNAAVVMPAMVNNNFRLRAGGMN
jgi:hypothetical protein